MWNYQYLATEVAAYGTFAILRPTQGATLPSAGLKAWPSPQFS